MSIDNVYVYDVPAGNESPVDLGKPVVFSENKSRNEGIFNPKKSIVLNEKSMRTES